MKASKIFLLLTYTILSLSSFGQKYSKEKVIRIKPRPESEQVQSDCSCTPIIYNSYIKFGKMNDIQREDYLLSNCFQPVKKRSSDPNLTYKEFTKCNLKEMKSGDIDLKLGDITVKIWSDNSVMLTTNKVNMYLSLKKEVTINSTSNYQDDGNDIFVIGKYEVNFKSSTNKDGDPIYMVTFLYGQL